MFSSIATITSERWTNQSPKNVNTYLHTYLLSSKTIRGSLFPLLPLRVKCQNHERVPISPISPILVVHVLSSCQDMGHQNRGNRDPLMVWALHPGKTLRGSLFPLRVKCQISPISPILVVHVHQNRGNRDPLMVWRLSDQIICPMSYYESIWPYESILTIWPSSITFGKFIKLPTKRVTCPICTSLRRGNVRNFADSLGFVLNKPAFNHVLLDRFEFFDVEDWKRDWCRVGFITKC